MSKLYLGRIAAVAADFGLIGAATLSAYLLRENLDLRPDNLIFLDFYFLSTCIAAVIILPLFDTGRMIWRLTSLSDYLLLLAATAAIVLAAMAIDFSIDRLFGIPRSFPLMQGILILLALVGGRVVARIRHGLRNRPTQLRNMPSLETGETVLIVGLNRLTELYLRSVSELARGKVRVAGILSANEGHVGRYAFGCEVLGDPEQAAEVLRNLEIHGIRADRILVIAAVESLTPLTRARLREIAQAGRVRVDFLAEWLLLGGAKDNEFVAPPSTIEVSSPGPVQVEQSVFAFPPDQLAKIGRRSYWRLKRALDFVAAAVLLLMLGPLVVLVAMLVAIDVGLPVTFWQQRPGLGGHPFNLYKFRTMASAFDTSGLRRSDETRVSVIGRFLRRTRLDELPQLLQILTGDMSFVGPRPLLPIDQPVYFSARLLVRPGLTGWAQVVAGRDVSPEDKSALDVWYVRNASFWLDINIVLRTIPMVLFGESVDRTAITRAWSDLNSPGATAALPELGKSGDGSASLGWRKAA